MRRCYRMDEVYPDGSTSPYVAKGMGAYMIVPTSLTRRPNLERVRCPDYASIWQKSRWGGASGSRQVRFPYLGL